MIQAFSRKNPEELSWAASAAQVSANIVSPS
jgi:hypothetical protein